MADDPHKIDQIHLGEELKIAGDGLHIKTDLDVSSNTIYISLHDLSGSMLNKGILFKTEDSGGEKEKLIKLGDSIIFKPYGDPQPYGETLNIDLSHNILTFKNDGNFNVFGDTLDETINIISGDILTIDERNLHILGDTNIKTGIDTSSNTLSISLIDTSGSIINSKGIYFSDTSSTKFVKLGENIDFSSNDNTTLDVKLDASGSIFEFVNKGYIHVAGDASGGIASDQIEVISGKATSAERRLEIVGDDQHIKTHADSANNTLKIYLHDLSGSILNKCVGVAASHSNLPLDKCYCYNLIDRKPPGGFEDFCIKFNDGDGTSAWIDYDPANHDHCSIDIRVNTHSPDLIINDDNNLALKVIHLHNNNKISKTTGTDANGIIYDFSLDSAGYIASPFSVMGSGTPEIYFYIDNFLVESSSNIFGEFEFDHTRTDLTGGNTTRNIVVSTSVGRPYSPSRTSAWYKIEVEISIIDGKLQDTFLMMHGSVQNTINYDISSSCKVINMEVSPSEGEKYTAKIKCTIFTGTATNINVQDFSFYINEALSLELSNADHLTPLKNYEPPDNGTTRVFSLRPALH